MVVGNGRMIRITVIFIASVILTGCTSTWAIPPGKTEADLRRAHEHCYWTAWSMSECLKGKGYIQVTNAEAQKMQADAQKPIKIGAYDVRTAEILTGKAEYTGSTARSITLEGVTSTLSCTGYAELTKQMPGGKGSIGATELLCRDGRKIIGQFVYDSMVSGYGSGADSKKNRYLFIFGRKLDVTANSLQAKFTELLEREEGRNSDKFGNGGGSRTRKSGGTGFVISDQGHILTNFHVVESCNEVRGKIGAETEKLTIVASDRSNDLAVLKIGSFVGEVAKFRGDQSVRAGDSMIVVGYPLQGLLTSLPSVTTGAVTALAGIGDDIRYYQISAPVQPGNSGGPVLDYSGQVVGLVVAKLDALVVARATGDIPQNINFAIKFSVIQNFLRTHGVSYQTASSDRELKPGQIGESASKYTIALECRR
ncbi:MAG: hypothetical protein CMM60_03695 [Rhodospirillaceae bacterium]|nr:hypothetical protein [Rhodospirillaceae bacterium]